MGAEGKSGVPVGLANTAEAIRGGKEGVTDGLHQPHLRRDDCCSLISMPRSPLRNNIHIGSDRVKPVDFNYPVSLSLESMF